MADCTNEVPTHTGMADHELSEPESSESMEGLPGNYQRSDTGYFTAYGPPPENEWSSDFPAHEHIDWGWLYLLIGGVAIGCIIIFVVITVCIVRYRRDRRSNHQHETMTRKIDEHLDSIKPVLNRGRTTSKETWISHPDQEGAVQIEGEANV